jgi:hypothetical protein
MRLFLRESFDQDLDDVEFEPEGEELEDLRRRQAAGEIADELDPAFVLLILQAMVAAPVVFPGEAKRLMGLDPASDEFRRRMEDQIRRIVRRLA